MKRIQHNGTEYSVTFTYERKVTKKKVRGKVAPTDLERTTCTILEGQIGSKDTEKTVAHKGSCSQFIKDNPNRNVGRHESLSKALSNVPNGPELRKAIIEGLKLRSSGCSTE